MSRGAVLLCGTLLLSLPATARADWLLSPFVGITFGEASPFVDSDLVEHDKKSTLGVAVSAIGDSGLGFETELAFSPGFFQKGGAQGLVASSHQTTLMGNLVVAAPGRLTRYTLRPFVTGGIGLMNSKIQNTSPSAFTFTDSYLGMNAGGGVIGFLTRRTGVRWDLRYFRNVSAPKPQGLYSPTETRFRYWRASMALVVRP
ncbi:MAG: outer membrane beta-barrel protein [Vicinamibacterales bacterium]